MDIGLPFGGPYGVILADPPWRFSTWSPKGKGRSADRHYPTMPLAEISALPVADVAARDAVLFLWATVPFLPAALGVMADWGFAYKTVAFVWVKTNRDGETIFNGQGYWTRQNAEFVLFGRRGDSKRVGRDVHSVVMSRRREHSRKPDEIAARIERLMGPVAVSGPRLELFARTRRPGWDAWGNEVGKFPDRAATDA